MKKAFAASLSLLLLTVSGLAMAWDGNWTNARSGGGDGYIYHPKDSHSDAGTKERPQKFLIPPPRDYVDVDPEELADYFDRKNRHYAPYAMARVTRDIRYNNIVIPKGYYLVKAGDLSDGSPKTNLQTLQDPALASMNAVHASQPRHLPSEEAGITSDTGPNILDNLYTSISARSLQQAAPEPSDLHCRRANNCPPETQSVVVEDSVRLRLEPAPVSAEEPPDVIDGRKVQRAFIFKRLGKVVAVVPIHEMETYRPKRKENLPRHALAWLEVQDERPILKFYYKHRIYTTYFQ